MRVGERTNAIAGTSMMTAAMVAFAIGAYNASVELVIVGLVLQGVGNGVARPSLTASLTNAVDEKDVGIASASNRMLHQIGASFGIAVLTAIYGGSRTGQAFGRAHIFGAFLGLASVIAASLVRSTPRERKQADREVAEEVPVGGQ